MELATTTEKLEAASAAAEAERSAQFPIPVCPHTLATPNKALCSPTGKQINRFLRHHRQRYAGTAQAAL
jgi:hypothetical protein